MDFKSVLIPSLAIIYILSPLDIIPDWLLGIGSLDDFAILALTLPFVLKELEKFLAWEQEQKIEPITSQTPKLFNKTFVFLIKNRFKQFFCWSDFIFL